ncbi:NACHT, LRR and PYD domains-containing protein 3-like isoform X2 [Chelmon rostratus]|uniref:NACHT, LRR and PYD domains-containing protein 3-like isoform X2 n=1 Tax=Chelmon rostratus TaxID=109905 RepID=UPI001BE786B7|nr:NACHT, LRR and PYD domains-containing protein 3-like isoform X2 [Chelmon rostratus]
MGSQCSTLRRDKSKEAEYYKPNQKKGEVSSTVQSGEESYLLQRRPSVQEEGGAVKEIREEGTLRKQEDEDTVSATLGCSETSSSLERECTVAERNTTSPCPSGARSAASAITEEKEAEWVDSNRAKLIQSITSVMDIADEMFQLRIIHNETYANIRAARTSQEQMRELYGALTSVKAKSAFRRILQEIHPDICQKDVIQEVIRKHKAYLRDKFRYEFEGTAKDHKDAQSLDKIYTELHVIQGESERINEEHEIWEIEDKVRSQTAEGVKINCNDIFKSASSGQDRRGVRAVRTVMTKGIAGIGKTVSVKKFILDWADGGANQDLDFIFVLPFRELNLVIDKFSLETLVKDFHPELKNVAVARIFANHKVLFVFDGLDESQLKLDFQTTERLTDATKESSVDVLVTNLIREHLLPSAFVWITSRPGAVQRIPRQYVYQWTEVRGFNDPQKIQYFRKRVEDKAVAERIINNIMMSRSLYIMCHIPIFCWIAAKVLAHLLLKVDASQEENIKIPTTLTEMYTHFLCIQMQVATEKYHSQNEVNTEEVFRSNEEFILKLGRMAFEHLKEGKIIFTGNDLKSYGIDIRKAGVYCGLCTEIFKEESVFNTRKLYCFVHLTVQEYFAALFVYHSFASKKIDSLSLKDFLLIGSEEELKPILDADPVDLPLDELMEISIANSTLRKTGELDMFLRFLIGLSLKSTQELLQGLIQQTEEHTAVVEEIRTSLKEIDLADCSPARCLNLVHCLIELKDSSLHDTVQQYLKPNHNPETQLSPVQCSALADSILMSSVPLDEFDLKRYRPSAKGVFRLVPAVRNSRKARISGVDLDVWLCETISSALQMPNSVLTELHLINCNFYEGTKILTDALTNCQCKLEALCLSGRGFLQTKCEKLASAIKAVASNLRELELSSNILGGLLCSVLSGGLGSLEKLRLNRNPQIAKICKELVAALTSSPCPLRELELSYTSFQDSEMEILCAGLMSTNCNLRVLSLSHNRLTEKGCKTLASALSSRPSCLTKLDLSYNDLQDSGVTALCGALQNPHCGLETLRLSFCKVTGDGCAALATALRRDHCSLRELDLSFNHLAGRGVKMLTDVQTDPRCSLETLNVEQNEECWFDLKLLRQYACDLTLDPNTAAVNISLTEDKKEAIYVGEKQSYPDHPERFDSRQVLCEEGLTGRHYWEVECVRSDVGVAYKSMDRVGDCSSQFSLGNNEKSWCWFYEGRFHHNNSCLKFMHQTSRSTIGVYLDWPAGILSFFEVFPDTLTHLYTVRTTFTEPLHPGFGLDDGSVCLCKIK